MAKECCKTVKKQFSSHKLLLGSKHPEKFVQTECLSQNVYLVWRLIWMLYHCGAIVASGILERHYATTTSNRVKWFIFLTNWAYLTLTLAVIADFAAVTYFRCAARAVNNDNAVKMPWFLKVVWLLFNISNAIGIEISIIYWGLIHDVEWGLAGYRILPFLTHGMNTLYIVLNLLVTGIPVRLLHFWQPLTFGLVYGVFSLAYTMAGETNDMDEPFIYSILDWNKRPGLTAGILCGASIGAVLVHFLLYCLYKVKMVFVKLLCGRNESLVSPCQQ
ncbi:protein rolling stone-like [Gigantopelta aegis]|uniref:protein rolling stone-like n=1 Tax=Gigantopelta aegis TaxID=1735272 RepID=UPI001B88A6B3|nr:protein rolling stone-like [Gigantopelta aegis]